jgi:hypothetical protein
MLWDEPIRWVAYCGFSSARADSDAWFQQLSELAEVLSLPEGVTQMSNVKIAIIDSGIDPQHPHMGQVKGYRDFVTGQDDIKLDQTGHGSTGVDLICKVLGDHNPEIYVARVFEESRGTVVEADRIAEVRAELCAPSARQITDWHTGNEACAP